MLGQLLREGFAWRCRCQRSAFEAADRRVFSIRAVSTRRLAKMASGNEAVAAAPRPERRLRRTRSSFWVQGVPRIEALPSPETLEPLRHWWLVAPLPLARETAEARRLPGARSRRGQAPSWRSSKRCRKPRCRRDISAGALATAAHADEAGLAPASVSSGRIGTPRRKVAHLIAFQSALYRSSTEIRSAKCAASIRSALDGGEDGLDAYRIIASGAGAHLEAGAKVAARSATVSGGGGRVLPSRHRPICGKGSAD